MLLALEKAQRLRLATTTNLFALDKSQRWLGLRR
jgi:hypothetical protein